ncbi:hypothetical protein ACFL0L_02475 [Patescibacteria group bacterium]
MLTIPVPSQTVDPKQELVIGTFPDAREGDTVVSGEVGLALARIFTQNDTEFLVVSGGAHDGEIFIFPKMYGNLVGKRINVVVRGGELAFEPII